VWIENEFLKTGGTSQGHWQNRTKTKIEILNICAVLAMQRGVRRFFYTAKRMLLFKYKFSSSIKMTAAEHKLRRASQPRAIKRFTYIPF